MELVELPGIGGEPGRGDELARLDAAWDDPKTHLVTLVAWGGIAKTSLVAKWAARLAARDTSYDGASYFDWSFHGQGTRETAGPSSDAFVAAASIQGGEKPSTVPGNGRRPLACHCHPASNLKMTGIFTRQFH